MGSLRNPIGPLPSSIYWRRRAVALAVLALLVLLILWALSLGGGGGGTDNDGKGGHGGPASSITPGPTDSGPAITQRPGGREDSGGSGDSGGSAGSGGSGTSGGGGADGASGAQSGGAGGGAGGGGSVWVPGGSAAGGGSGSGSGSAGGSGSGSGSGSGGWPAACARDAVSVSLHSVHKKYGPDEKPKFELTVKNKRGTACTVDLGRKATVVTIDDSHGHAYWASDDCAGPAPAARVRLPGDGESTHTFTWQRKPSTDKCGEQAKSSAKDGGYTIKVTVPHLKKATAAFDLES